MATFYLDGTNLVNSTAVYIDADLADLAPDDYYSDGGNIVRQQLNGVLLPATACPSCVVPIPCNTLPDFPAGQGGRYPLDITIGDTSADVGAIVISFFTGTAPDGIKVSYDGTDYNGLTSSSDGWKEGTAGGFIFLGNDDDACSLDLTSNAPYTPTLDNYALNNQGTAWNSEGTQSSVSIAAGDLQFEHNSKMSDSGYKTWNTMVIPKPNNLPSSISVTLASTCSNTYWGLDMVCPGPLSPTTLWRSNENDTNVCGVSQVPSPTYYIAGHNSRYTTRDSVSKTRVGIYDLIFSDDGGNNKIAAGEYRIDWNQKGVVSSDSVLTDTEPCTTTTTTNTYIRSPFYSLSDTGGLYCLAWGIPYQTTVEAVCIITFKPTAGAVGIKALQRNNRGTRSLYDNLNFSGWASTSGMYAEEISASVPKKEDRYCFFGEPTNSKVIEMTTNGNAYNYSLLPIKSRSFNADASLVGTAGGSTWHGNYFFESGAYSEIYTLVIPMDEMFEETTSIYVDVITPTGGAANTNDYEVKMEVVENLQSIGMSISQCCPEVSSTDACANQEASNMFNLYRAGGGTQAATSPSIGDFVFKEPKGTEKLDSGWYAHRDTATTSFAFEVDDNGVVTDIVTCP